VHTSPVCTSSLTQPCVHGGREGGRVGRGIVRGRSKPSLDTMRRASRGRGWPVAGREEGAKRVGGRAGRVGRVGGRAVRVGRIGRGMRGGRAGRVVGGKTCGGRQDAFGGQDASLGRPVRRAGMRCGQGAWTWAGRLDVGRAREWAGPGVRLDMLKGERRGARTCACACGRTCGRACLPARPPARTCPHHTVVAGGGGRGWQVVRGRADRPEGVREGRRGCCVA